MDIALGAGVHFSTGETGKVTRVIGNPITGEMTHIVVKMKGATEAEYLVPLDKIAGSTPKDVTLAISLNDLFLLEPFERIHYQSKSEPITDSSDPSSLFWPFLPPGGEGDMYKVETQVRSEDLIIRRGAEVSAVDGKIGKVDGFMVDPSNNHVTHLVLEKGHFWGHRDVAIPIDAVDAYDGKTVTLKLDKKSVNALPRLEFKRH